MKTQKQIKRKIGEKNRTLKIIREDIRAHKFRNETPADKAMWNAEKQLRIEIEMLQWILK